MSQLPRYPGQVRISPLSRCASIAAVGIGALFALPEGKAATLQEWNESFIAAIQAESTPPGLAARNLAIFHLSIHNAINRVSPRYVLFPDDSDGAKPVGLEKADPKEILATADAAAYRIATSLYPSRRSRFDRLMPELQRPPSDGAASSRADEDLEAALRCGREEADVILAWRSGDGSATNVHYVPDAAPGEWRRTLPGKRPPELPQWPDVRPFRLEKADQFRPDGPPKIDSPKYRDALEEIRALGGKESSVRTEEQSLIARFWADFTYTSTPPGHWNEIARQITAGLDLDLHDSARAFALLNLVMADAGIAAFECKYHYNFWRPVTAIQRADEDGLESTESDLSWVSYLPSPPHPEYVSAHSTFSGAAAEVLRRIAGGKEITFIATSIDVPGTERRYTNFRACAEEIGMSRLYGGIHYRFSNDDGLDLGRQLAGWICERSLLKREEP